MILPHLSPNYFGDLETEPLNPLFLGVLETESFPDNIYDVGAAKTTETHRLVAEIEGDVGGLGRLQTRPPLVAGVPWGERAGSGGGILDALRSIFFRFFVKEKVLLEGGNLF